MWSMLAGLALFVMVALLVLRMSEMTVRMKTYETFIMEAVTRTDLREAMRKQRELGKV